MRHFYKPYIILIGPHIGACVCLENKIGKKLLSFACRHHFHELIPASIYNTLFGASNGPGYPLFQRFQKSWRKGEINKKNFKSGLEDPDMATFLLELKKELIDFVQDQLKKHHPRDDYEEYLILVLRLCGETHKKVTKFLFS